MRITFVLPNIEISGGVKAVFEFANHLQDREHTVRVLYPAVVTQPGVKQILMDRLQRFTSNPKCVPGLDWFDLRAELIRVPTLAERNIPQAEIVVATWWRTAYSVSGYDASKGVKFYLAQHYEIWGGSEKAVNHSYQLGLHIIANSTWLKNILQDKLKVKVQALILHAPDLDQFYPENRQSNGSQIRILMPYRNLEWKGIQDGISAFELVKEHFPEVQLVMFGPEADAKVPAYVEYHGKVFKDKLRRIYNSCDIFVFPSHVEGFGMPPMEAMLCKCAVVTTNVGAVPDYAIPEKTALICPPRSPELLAQNIIRLIQDPELRLRIVEKGYRQIRENFSWSKATDELESCFREVLK